MPLTILHIAVLSCAAAGGWLGASSKIRWIRKLVGNGYDVPEGIEKIIPAIMGFIFTGSFGFAMLVLASILLKILYGL